MIYGFNDDKEKNEIAGLFVFADQEGSVTIEAGATALCSISVSKQGYKCLGVVGYYVPNDYAVESLNFVLDNNPRVGMRIKNNGSQRLQILPKVTALYVKV